MRKSKSDLQIFFLGQQLKYWSHCRGITTRQLEFLEGKGKKCYGVLFATSYIFPLFLYLEKLQVGIPHDDYLYYDWDVLSTGCACCVRVEFVNRKHGTVTPTIFSRCSWVPQESNKWTIQSGFFIWSPTWIRQMHIYVHCYPFVHCDIHLMYNCWQAGHPWLFTVC